MSGAVRHQFVPHPAANSATWTVTAPRSLPADPPTRRGPARLRGQNLAGLAAGLHGLTLRWGFGVGAASSDSGLTAPPAACLDLHLSIDESGRCEAGFRVGGRLRSASGFAPPQTLPCRVIEDWASGIIHVEAPGLITLAFDAKGAALAAGDALPPTRIRSTILYARGPLIEQARLAAGAPAGGAELIAARRDRTRSQG